MRGSFILTDHEPALRFFDQQISLHTQSRPEQRKQHQQEIFDTHYAPLYALQEQYDGNPERVRAWLNLWTSQQRNAQSTALQHWESALKDASSPDGLALRAWLATRSQRWQMLSAKLELPMPTAFRVYRIAKMWRDGDFSGGHTGLQDAFAVIRDVVSLWQRPDDLLEARQRRLGSWSLSESGLYSHVSQARIALKYEAVIPFNATLADKWVDDSAFIEFSPEREVIAIAPTEVVARNITVVLDGESYAHDRLSQLAEACVEKHGVRL